MTHGSRGHGRRHQARIGAAAVCAAVLVGGPAAAADLMPWAEKAIHEHVDFNQFEGVLTADQLHQLVDDGKALFTARFTTADGLGRPMATQAIIPTLRKHPVDVMFRRTAGLDGNNCRSCHNEPVTGGCRRFHRQRLHLRGLRECRLRYARSAVLQRARLGVACSATASSSCLPAR